MNKKKFHVGYGLFFGVLFSLFFVFSSTTCLGLETGRMTYDQSKYLFDYFLTNKYFTHDVFSFSWDSDSTPEIYGRDTLYRNQMYNLYYNTTNIENFVTAFNDIDTQYNNLGVEHYLFYCFGNTEYFWIRFLPINNTIGNDVPHLRIGIYNNYSATGYGVATNVLIRPTETSNYEQLNVRFDTSGNYYPYARGSYDVKYLSYKGADNLFARVPGYSDTVCYAIQNMTSINNSYFYSTSALNVVQPDYNAYTSVYILKSFYEPPTPTPTPTPTPSPGDGSSGTITDNNGSVTGSIDLSGIENGIKDVQNQISGDTQRIIDNQNIIAQQQHNDLTSFNTLEGESDADDLINNIQDTLDDNLSNSQIFGALEESESGFLDLISGQAEDFEIHWNDVFYNNVKLIPGGQVNFSALCRDNPTLGNVKEKLNIILSALCGLALIKYLYNLLLATLGIDNPYLYDKNTDSDYIKTVDKNSGVTTFSGKDKDGSRWTYRFDPRKGGKKK